MAHIKRIRRELALKAHIFEYYRDTVQTPAGKICEWDFICHPGAAAIVPVREDGRIVLVRQYRDALDRLTLEIPAGGLEEGGKEPTRTAALRELREETGYVGDEASLLLSIRTMVAMGNEKIDIYLARDVKPGRQQLDEDEYIEVLDFSLEELLEMIYGGQIQDAKTVAGILAYAGRYAAEK